MLADENGVSIKVAKYAGTDKVDLIENEEYGYCSLIKATNQVLEKMKIENVTKAKVTSTKRIEQNLVEPVPLREALINAVIHNDFTREIPPVFEIFSDRIEITSYGGLISGQSEEDFFSCSSMPRNRELMRVFKDVGLVEQLGSGMSRILKCYDRDIFKISDHFIKVVFPYAVPIPEKTDFTEEESDIVNDIINEDGTINGTINDTINSMDEDKKIVLTIMNEMPRITIKSISEKTGFSTRKINRIIKELREAGTLERVGARKKGYWKVNKNSF